MLYLILAALCSAVLTLVLKLFRNPKGNRFGIILGNYLTCVLIAFLQMPEKGRLFAVSSSTLLMSAAAGFLYVAGLVFTQTSVRKNGATLTSAFSRLGLIVPLTVSFLFFDEVPSLLKIGGLVLAGAAIWLINSSAGENPAVQASSGGERKNPAVLLMTLLACGCSETMAKVFSRLGDQGEDTRYRIVYSYPGGVWYDMAAKAFEQETYVHQEIELKLMPAASRADRNFGSISSGSTTPHSREVR